MTRIRRFMLIGILVASVAPLQACIVVVPAHPVPRPPGPFLMHEDHPAANTTRARTSRATHPGLDARRAPNGSRTSDVTR